MEGIILNIKSYNDYVEITENEKTLKIEPDDCLEWYIKNFDILFYQFYDNTKFGIDLSSPPRVLKSKFDDTEYFFPSTPEDANVMQGYIPPFLNLSHKDIVMDIGSFVGITSIYYAKRVKTVHSFEPVTASYNCLCTNIIRSGLNNIIPYKYGIWKETDVIEMSSNQGGGNRILTPGLDSNPYIGITRERMREDSYYIPVLNLITATKMMNEIPTIIKMDIEGAEIEVIQGNLPFIKNNDLKFAIACYHEINGVQTSYYLQKLFKSIGYKTRLEYPPHLTLHAWRD